jgi:hypothetical protein
LIGHLQHDEKLIIVLVEMRPLAGTKHILQRERMNAEMFAQLLQGIDITEPANIDPVHPRSVEGIEVGYLDLALLERVSIVLDQLELRFTAGLIGQRNQCCRWRTRSGIAEFLHRTAKSWMKSRPENSGKRINEPRMDPPSLSVATVTDSATELRRTSC